MDKLYLPASYEASNEEILLHGYLLPENLDNTMVFILDGCSFRYAHIWSKSGISICQKHLVPSKESSNPIFFFGKDLFLHFTSATCSELPSYNSTMGKILKVT